MFVSISIYNSTDHIDLCPDQRNIWCIRTLSLSNDVKSSELSADKYTSFSLGKIWSKDSSLTSNYESLDIKEFQNTVQFSNPLMFVNLSFILPEKLVTYNLQASFFVWQMNTWMDCLTFYSIHRKTYIFINFQLQMMRNT